MKKRNEYVALVVGFVPNHKVREALDQLISIYTSSGGKCSNPRARDVVVAHVHFVLVDSSSEYLALSLDWEGMPGWNPWPQGAEFFTKEDSSAAFYFLFLGDKISPVSIDVFRLSGNYGGGE